MEVPSQNGSFVFREIIWQLSKTEWFSEIEAGSERHESWLGVASVARSRASFLALLCMLVCVFL
jgi:hypothetical protein